MSVPHTQSCQAISGPANQFVLDMTMMSVGRVPVL
jgi:hypothetical protein